MSNLKKLLLANWSVTRVVRVGLGFLFGLQAIQEGEWILLIIALFLLYQGIANVTCGSCETGVCKTKTHK